MIINFKKINKTKRINSGYDPQTVQHIHNTVCACCWWASGSHPWGWRPTPLLKSGSERHDHRAPCQPRYTSQMVPQHEICYGRLWASHDAGNPVLDHSSLQHPDSPQTLLVAKALRRGQANSNDDRMTDGTNSFCKLNDIDNKMTDYLKIPFFKFSPHCSLVMHDSRNWHTQGEQRCCSTISIKQYPAK